MQRETGEPSDREQCHSLRDRASSPYVRGQPKGHEVACGPGQLEGEMAPYISEVGDLSFSGESDLEPVGKTSLSRGAHSSQRCCPAPREPFLIDHCNSGTGVKGGAHFRAESGSVAWVV